MKDKINKIKDFKNKIQELKKHNYLYFNKDKPIISDLKYDELKCESIFTFLGGAITVNSVLVLLSNLYALALVVKK